MSKAASDTLEKVSVEFEAEVLADLESGRLGQRRVWTNAGQRLSMNRCRMCIFYSGHVQGVGFRYTTKTVAAGFEVTGSVRNLPDGRVELIAEGARAELEVFRAAIRDAGLSGLIRDEKVTWSDAQNELHGFEIAG